MKELTRIIKYLIIIIVLFVALDTIVGVVFNRLLSSLPDDGDKVAKANFVINRMSSECIVVGSSRALSHYDTRVLVDSIPNTTIYNCGIDGQGTYYTDVLVNLLLDRYSPKTIIWDFKYLEFTKPGIDNLSMLYPYYYSNKSVKSFLDRVEPTLQYTIWINSYRYNGTASRIIKSSISNTNSSNLGFESHSSTITSKDIVCDTINIETDVLDNEKVNLFEKTVQRIKESGIELYVVLSPVFDKLKGDNKTVDALKCLASKYNFVVIDFSQDPDFVGNVAYVYDKDHLNAVGADLFTKKMVNKILEYRVVHTNENSIANNNQRGDK